MKFSIFNRFHPARLRQNWMESSKINEEGELLHLWSTPIYVFRNRLEPCKWHEPLKEVIRNRAQSEKTINANWKERDFFRWNEKPCVEFKQFLDERIRVRLRADFTSARLEQLQWDCLGWANYKKGLDWHWIHLHPRSSLSFVYYLSSLPSAHQDVSRPDFNGDYYGGTLEFTDPRGAAPYMVSQLMNDAVEHFKFFVTPTEGMLLIFPSYLAHMISPMKADEERVSVAGNFGNFRLK